MKVSEEVQGVLNAAYLDAKERHHEYLTPEHILYATIFFDQGRSILEECGVDLETVKHDIEEHLQKNVPVAKNGEPVQSIGFQGVIERAVFHTEASSKGVVDIGDILVSILDQKDSFGSYYLKKAGITRYDLLRVISHGGLSDDDDEPADDSDSGDATERATTATKDKAAPGKKSALALYTRELTQAAKDNQLEPLIGREDILERTIQVLCRRLKNNPIHVGDAGVGKTADHRGPCPAHRRRRGAPAPARLHVYLPRHGRPPRGHQVPRRLRGADQEGR